jgi:hypothetical protein
MTDASTPHPRLGTARPAEGRRDVAENQHRPATIDAVMKKEDNAGRNRIRIPGRPDFSLEILPCLSHCE